MGLGTILRGAVQAYPYARDDMQKSRLASEQLASLREERDERRRLRGSQKAVDEAMALYMLAREKAVKTGDVSVLDDAYDNFARSGADAKTLAEFGKLHEATRTQIAGGETPSQKAATEREMLGRGYQPLSEATLAQDPGARFLTTTSSGGPMSEVLQAARAQGAPAWQPTPERRAQTEADLEYKRAQTQAQRQMGNWRDRQDTYNLDSPFEGWKEYGEALDAWRKQYFDKDGDLLPGLTKVPNFIDWALEKRTLFKKPPEDTPKTKGPRRNPRGDVVDQTVYVGEKGELSGDPYALPYTGPEGAPAPKPTLRGAPQAAPQDTATVQGDLAQYIERKTQELVSRGIPEAQARQIIMNKVRQMGLAR